MSKDNDQSKRKGRPRRVADLDNPKQKAIKSEELDNLPKAYFEKAEEVQRDTIIQFMNWLDEEKQYMRKVDIHSLSSIISEYLDGFLVVGFDVNGEHVCFGRESSDMQRHAINELLKHVIFKRNMGLLQG